MYAPTQGASYALVYWHELQRQLVSARLGRKKLLLASPVYNSNLAFLFGGSAGRPAVDDGFSTATVRYCQPSYSTPCSAIRQHRLVRPPGWVLVEC